MSNTWNTTSLSWPPRSLIVPLPKSHHLYQRGPGRYVAWNGRIGAGPIHWDLWIGPAPMRPFHATYLPGPRWYRWWDFGSGTMSDLGGHDNDVMFQMFDVRYPLTIEAVSPM